MAVGLAAPASSAPSGAGTMAKGSRSLTVLQLLACLLFPIPVSCLAEIHRGERVSGLIVVLVFDALVGVVVFRMAILPGCST